MEAKPSNTKLAQANGTHSVKENGPLPSTFPETIQAGVPGIQLYEFVRMVLMHVNQLYLNFLVV